MTLQNQVFLSPALGLIGAKADLNAFDYFPQSLQAQEDISVGSFVWPGADPASQAAYQGSGPPLGLVEREVMSAAQSRAEASQIIAQGQNVTVALRGCYYVQSQNAAEPGQSVFARFSDGAIVCGPAKTEISGAVESGWQVISAGEAGETIIIKRS